MQARRKYRAMPLRIFSAIQPEFDGVVLNKSVICSFMQPTLANAKALHQQDSSVIKTCLF